MADLFPPKQRRNAGKGYLYHQPDCICFVCSAARKRQTEADSGGAREEALATQVDQAPVNADDASPEEIATFIVPGRDITKQRVAAWIVMRGEEPGISDKEIAERLNISPYTLKAAIQKAVKDRWLVFDDPMRRIKHEVIPRTIDNLNYFLGEKDKAVTIETAKGVVYPMFRESEGIQDAPQTVLALKIEAAEPDQVKVITGTIVGKPREIE